MKKIEPNFHLRIIPLSSTDYRKFLNQKIILKLSDHMWARITIHYFHGVMLRLTDGPVKVMYYPFARMFIFYNGLVFCLPTMRILLFAKFNRGLKCVSSSM